MDNIYIKVNAKTNQFNEILYHLLNVIVFLGSLNEILIFNRPF
jgi:hypothetical protein